MEKSERFYFLDYLKAFIILLVIILHAQMCYSTIPFPYWVLDPNKHPIFNLLFIMIEQPLMTCMFFIAGYFTIPSLVKQGPVEFLKKKLLRLLIPLAIGIVVLTSTATYITELSRGKQMGFITFFTGYFTSDLFNQFHLWFLGVLLLFFILIALVYIPAKKLFQDTRKTVKPSLLLLLAIPAVCTVLFTLTGLFYSVLDWVMTWVIQFQNIRILSYGVYFIVGMYAFKCSWFTKEGYKPKIIPWSILFVVSLALYLVCFTLRFMNDKDTLVNTFAIGISYSFACFAGLLMFLGIFQKYCNFSSPLAKTISKASYPVYIIHLTILFFIAYLFMSFSLPAGVKFLIVTSITVGITWIAAIGLQKIPGVNKIV